MTTVSDNVLHAVAGAGGGVLSMVLTYPLITLSTRSQVESKRAQSTVMDAVRKILEREGMGGLYAGLDSAVFGISVTNFVYYYWYEFSRSAFEKAATKGGRRSSKLTTVESMIAGAIAGSATVLTTNPIWVVNTRMTARKRTTIAASEAAPEPGKKPAPPSTIGEIRALLKEGGLKAFFAGVLPALVLVINPILQYTIFEQLKNFLERRRKRGISPSDAFLLGAIGKLAATGLTYPYITIKARMHVAGKDDKHVGIIQSLRNILKTEGWAGLYGGIGPKLVQSVLTAAFLFAFKDALYNATRAALVRQRAAKKLKA
ncbi:peroxisomal membrane protein PMP47B [Geopyxis carbonaria]|nr:peroxisomal membrane protein PMP47B [Geopyxis carbonaria]